MSYAVALKKMQLFIEVLGPHLIVAYKVATSVKIHLLRFLNEVGFSGTQSNTDSNQRTSLDYFFFLDF